MSKSRRKYVTVTGKWQDRTYFYGKDHIVDRRSTCPLCSTLRKKVYLNKVTFPRRRNHEQEDLGYLCFMCNSFFYINLKFRPFIAELEKPVKEWTPIEQQVLEVLKEHKDEWLTTYEIHDYIKKGSFSSVETLMSRLFLHKKKVIRRFRDGKNIFTEGAGEGCSYKRRFEYKIKEECA